jgi:lysozyme family protein
MTTDEIITGLVLREGRVYTNDPTDHGGPTKFGITLRDLRSWRNDPTLHEDAVETLTESEARDIYRKRYVLDPGFDTVPNDWLRDFLVDTGVLQGTRVSIKFLQRAVGVETDGVLGPVTLEALRTADPEWVKRMVLRDRIQHLAACALVDVPGDVVQGTNLKFLRGWLNRVSTFF